MRAFLLLALLPAGCVPPPKLPESLRTRGPLREWWKKGVETVRVLD